MQHENIPNTHVSAYCRKSLWSTLTCNKHENSEVLCSIHNKSPYEMFEDSRLQIHVTLNEIWLYESDPNAPSTWSEPGGKQWQRSIRGRRDWDVELGPCAVIQQLRSVAFVWETKRPHADNSRSLIDRQVSCFPRSSIKFQGHTGQNITDFDPNWAFPDYRPVAAFKSLRFALFIDSLNQLQFVGCCYVYWWQ